MAQLGKSILLNSKKDLEKSNPRNTKSNPLASRDGKRSLWFSSLVIALLLAFVLLAFDFSSIGVHQWQVGQIAASDVYSPSRLTINDGMETSHYLPGEVVVRRGEKVTGAICVALNVISAQSFGKKMVDAMKAKGIAHFESRGNADDAVWKYLKQK